MIFQLDPSAGPFVSKVNGEIAFSQRLNFAELYRQDIVAFPGDPLASTGKMIPGTSLYYADATTVQYLIGFYYEESGMIVPDNMQSILDTNKGPDEPWNYPYCNNGWGLQNSLPNGKLQITTALRKSDGTQEVVIVIP